MNFTHLGDELVYEGKIWSLVRASFTSPDGVAFGRDVVRSPGSVGVVALTGPSASPQVTLVSQYRPAFDRPVLEIPAGMRDIPGEPPVATANRELAEEVGLATDAPLHLLIDLIPSPGMTDAVCSVFMAIECYRVDNDLQGPEEQHLELVTMDLAEAAARVHAGEITDAKSAVGLLLAAARFER